MDTSRIPIVLAHVKWFAHYDVSRPPLPIGQVLTKPFIYLFLLFVFFVYLFFLADRAAYRKGYFIEFDKKVGDLNRFSLTLLRLCAGIFFVSIAIYSRVSHDIFLITPELKTTQLIIPYLQLAIGLCALSRRTLPLVSFGIIALYIDAVVHYGVYHLLDYLIFLGIAYFFLVANRESEQWRKSGFIVLYATTGITLLWAAMEKFAYPDWSYPVLQNHPSLLIGLSPHVFMLLSGYVEFALTFVLLGAASILGRALALGLESIFVLAIIPFGPLDAMGHLMIIAILLVLIIRGPTTARGMVILSKKSIWTEAYFLTGLYFLAFDMFFLMYYGFHYLAYGS
jgi:hypothetical protein